jgi:hypothetical protein
MAAENSTRTPNGFVVFVGTAAALIGVAAIFVAKLAFTGASDAGDEVEKKRAAQRMEIREKLDKEAVEQLNSEGWTDKAKGIAHIPITDAMSAVIPELNAKKPAPSSVKVEPPLPMPVADPNSKEPAPPALPSAPQGADTIRFPIPAAPVAPATAPEKPAEPAPSAPAPVAPPAPAAEKPAEPAPAKPAEPAAPVAPESPAQAPNTNPTEKPEPTK